jgi:hypothetical protein
MSLASMEECSPRSRTGALIPLAIVVSAMVRVAL